eukprot:TRINITY_DN307_c0_g2_i1.p1 TRINITY_DN307_c0_g2~~TRINITY_DN307_c0_g2_i1.p1  ORF type:complete len:178 (-),score=34.71 TRINITY_DN307_c0_g2_i1:55-588(-)
MSYKEFSVVGRKKPTSADPAPKIYRMRLFATNDVVAKSRFWYFLGKTQKIKRCNGEIISVNQLFETDGGRQVKNFGVSLRYVSRSGQHNIQKEYRDVTRVGAVEQMLTDMGARHRTNYRRIQIMEVKALKASECVRPNTKQFHDSKIKFPLPHRVYRAESRRYKNVFSRKRVHTHFL